MFAKREIRCEDCGTLNRVRTYSFRQIPRCGNCHKPLPEPFSIRVMRGPYRWRWYFARLAALASPLALIVTIGLWIGPSPNDPTAANVIACTPQPRPTVGDYLVTDFSDRVAPFEVRTSSNLEYLIKLERVESTPHSLTFFVIGGQHFETDVPLGTYRLEYVAGKTWCGRSLLFGNQEAQEGRKLLTFERTTNGYDGRTVTLYGVPHGNFAAKAIPKSAF
jgi:hypothetical protein